MNDNERPEPQILLNIGGKVDPQVFLDIGGDIASETYEAFHSILGVCPFGKITWTDVCDAALDMPETLALLCAADDRVWIWMVKRTLSEVVFRKMGAGDEAITVGNA